MSAMETGASAHGQHGSESALDKGYEPSQVESRWAAFWESQGL